MGIKRKFMFTLLNRIGIPKLMSLIELERNVANYEDAILPTDSSPPRFDIPLEMIKRVKSNSEIPFQSLPPVRILPSLLGNMKKAITSLKDNPPDALKDADIEFLNDLVDYAFSLGVGIIGYTHLPRHLIFQDKGIIHANAIILAMEMDWDKIEASPSRSTQVMIMETYDALGIAANKIARFLRENGFSAMAGHPLGGQALYPPLAQNAGLGWIGRSGLLITPEFGPRVRLAAVFTSIENLPFSQNNQHAWINAYCTNCGVCIRRCPPTAILDAPISYESGRISHISQDLCFPYFVENYGCSICIKVCPFNRSRYDDIKKKHDSGDMS